MEKLLVILPDGNSRDSVEFDKSIKLNFTLKHLKYVF